MAAIFGKGTLIQYGDTTNEDTASYTTVADAKTITGPGLEAEEVDVTSHDSSGDFRQFVRGLIDGGEITAEFNWDPELANHQQMLTFLNAGTIRAWRVHWAQMATPYEMTFQAFVKSMPLTNPVDNVLTANLTLRVSSAPTLSVV